jgi:DNA topoisomerase I
MDVVVVESPAKARTINKYLGNKYVVLASYGHVRDLPSRAGSVEPARDFAMHYESEPRSAKHLKAIADALKGASVLYLATDPDREGEAISWHILEVLKERRALRDVAVKRVAFAEITKHAVLEAMSHPRELDTDLIDAQQARRALDYLVGFTLSPVLWRKLPGARSAGRVQSVALRLICEREIEIEAFKPREYWTVEIEMSGPDGGKFAARLVSLDGRKLDKFDIANETQARAVAARIAAGEFHVTAVDTKPSKRYPAAPFTTSTLQQEAARKLGFSAQQTMSLAQRLYEGVDVGDVTLGLITYMRTDGVQMASEAVGVARKVIADDYGRDFVPPGPRVYKAKTRNAQEAHEAIRPTEFALRPADVAGDLDTASARLYELIWKRALASQMEAADIERSSIDMTDQTGKIGLRASGQVIVFPGFLKLYEEGHDEDAENGDGGRLPRLAVGAGLGRAGTKPLQHFTEPPPRFSEASLVKRLEELGIGRPSTYASILGTLRERSYVRMEKARFIPEDKGRLVTAFLTDFFEHYFAYDFTANLEDRLDEIAEHRLDWKQVLREFWRDFSRAEDAAPAPLSIEDAIKRLDDVIGNRQVVLAAIDESLGPHFFPATADGKDSRVCPNCTQGRLGIRLGRNGAFIGCSRYPECSYTRNLAVDGDTAHAPREPTRPLGADPASGEIISLRSGPFGRYVQLGEAKPKEKPKRASIPKDIPVETVDLALALKLLAMPRLVGAHPESGQPINAGIGRYGPYLEHAKRYIRLGTSADAFTIGLNRAVDMIAEAPERQRRGQTVLRDLGPHPADGKPMAILEGRYGPYVKHGKTNANLPKGVSPEDMTVEAAIAALAARAGKPSRPSRGRKAAPRKDSGAKPKSPRAASGKTGKKPARRKVPAE